MYVDQPAFRLNAENRTIVVLPIGSCEQHGPHLPVDTDLRIAQLIAEKLTEAFSPEKAILLPAIPFSCSWEHKGPGMIALNTSTISAILYDIAYSLKTWNMPVFLVLLNWHGGNSILASLATEITAREHIPTTVIQALSLAGPMWPSENKVSFPDVHAGMIETSIVQAYWPNLVAHFEEINFIPDVEPASAQSIFQALGIYAVSKTGIWGKPQQSDPVKGKLIIDAIVKETHSQVTRLRELIEQQSA